MKKIALYALTLISVLSLIGCGKSKKNDNTEETPESALEYVSTSDNVLPSDNTVSEPVVSNPTEPDPVDGNISDNADGHNPGEHHGEIEALVARRDEVFAGPDTIYKTDAAHDINKQIAELNTYNFSGKKIACLGDSITYGQGSSVNEYGYYISYVDYLRDILGCETVNLGVPGSAIGSYSGDQAMLWRIDQIPQDSDVVIIFGGINDYFYGNSVYGSDTQVTQGTYYGDMDRFFSKLRERCPTQDIFVVLIYKNACETQPEYKDNYPLDTWLDVIRVYSPKYNFSKIEMYRTGFMNSSVPEIKANYFTDNVHPNATGQTIIARYLAAKLVEYYN